MRSLSWVLIVLGAGILPQGAWESLAAGSSAIESAVIPDDGSVAEVIRRIADGGTITVRPGIHLVEQRINTTSNRVTLRGEPGAVIRAASTLTGSAMLDIRGSGWLIEGLVFDGQFCPARGLKTRGSTRGFTIRKCEVRNWGYHALDLDGSDLLVENCRIHDNLKTTATGQRDDAHGVATLHAQGLTIRGCRIWNCSGDSVQPDRGSWQNVVIEDCDMYLEPLADDMGGFRRGDLVGENALDTKKAATDERGVVVVDNCRAWGFRNPREGSWAAFNLKEKVQVTVTGCTVRDSMIAFRLPSWRKGGRLHCEIRDCQISECDTAFRIEDQWKNDINEPGGSVVARCRVTGCQTGVEFTEAGGPSGQGVFEAGSSITESVFSPAMTLRLRGGNQPARNALRQQLLAAGNTEESTRPRRGPARR
ncbi:MAG: hypothetical protein EHM42_00910 [Planctomycetaceae bacterium]|nr:MAG: hypothetical protein EHM42_00910 [Planctomycetaceae bacterium]